MDQIAFQKAWIDSLRRLWGEFRDDLKLGELLTLMAVATHSNCTEEELAAHTGIEIRRLRQHLRALGPPARWWQRHHGLIQSLSSNQQPPQFRYSVSLKGALVVRTLYMLARLDDQPPAPTESAHWRF